METADLVSGTVSFAISFDWDKYRRNMECYGFCLFCFFTCEHTIQREYTEWGMRYQYPCSSWEENLAEVISVFILKSELATGLQADVP